jgi:hypothetical protein
MKSPRARASRRSLWACSSAAISGSLAAAARTSRSIGDTIEETSLAIAPQLRMIARGSVSRSRISSARR